MHEVDGELLAERAFHLLGLVAAQQPRVDEDARQLVADGLVHERRGNGGVDAARQPADHPFVADLRADLGDRVFDDRDVRPRRPAARRFVQERLQDFLPALRVHDLGVELHAVDHPFAVFQRGDRNTVGVRADRETGRRLRDGVTVAHPHDLLGRLALEEWRSAVAAQFGAAVLTRAGLAHLAAEIACDELRAVTDAEQRHARVVDRGVDRRRTVDMHRRGTAREDDRLRVAREHLRDRHRPRHDLAVHVRLADATRDQLRVLRPEVDDENEIGVGRAASHRN